MKVSVIIPVYNTSKYITKNLDSLISQTLDDMEFIYVDDGSSDNSADIIKSYMKKDKRIKLFLKENGGVASARNYGLIQAKGEYITFLDSDDYVASNMYEKLYTRAIKDDLDIVICNYYFDYGNRIVANKNNITDKDEKIILANEYVTLTPSVWNKIIKKSYLDKIKFSFPEGRIYEDLVAVPLLGLYNPKVVYLNEELYYYVQSDNSIMRNDEYKSKYEDIFEAIKEIYEYSKDSEYKNEFEYLITYHFLYLASLNFYKYKKYNFISRIADDMRLYAPKWYKNKLVLDKFSKKEIIYMKLFYYKKYKLIDIYRRLRQRDEYVKENN